MATGIMDIRERKRKIDELKALYGADSSPMMGGDMASIQNYPKNVQFNELIEQAHFVPSYSTGVGEQQTQVQQDPLRSRVDVSKHLDNVSKVQQNRNRWNARLAPFGGSVSFSSLGDINKMAGIVDEDIQGEIYTRLRQAILNGEIRGVADAMSWFNQQGFDPHFAKPTREAATAIIDQLMQEKKFDWDAVKYDEGRTTFQQTQDDRIISERNRVEEEQTAAQESLISGHASNIADQFNADFDQAKNDIDKTDQLYSDVRSFIDNDERYKDLSSEDKRLLNDQVQDNIESAIRQSSQADISSKQRLAWDVDDRSSAKTESIREKQTIIGSDKMVNAAVHEFNKKVSNGMSREAAANEVAQKLRGWSTNPNYVDMVYDSAAGDGGEWKVSETSSRRPSTQGPEELGTGGTIAGPTNVHDFDEDKLISSFLKTVRMSGTQAAATAAPADMKWVNEQRQNLTSTENYDIDRNNAQTAYLQELVKGGSTNSLWYELQLPQQEGIAIKNVINYMNLSNPDRINRNKILQDFENSKEMELILGWSERAKKAKKDEAATLLEKVESAIDKYKKEIAREYSVPEKFIDYILFPEQYQINIGRK